VQDKKTAPSSIKLECHLLGGQHESVLRILCSWYIPAWQAQGRVARMRYVCSGPKQSSLGGVLRLARTMPPLLITQIDCTVHRRSLPAPSLQHYVLGICPWENVTSLPNLTSEAWKRVHDHDLHAILLRSGTCETPLLIGRDSPDIGSSLGDGISGAI